jgi:hypothetical protein
MIGTDVSSCLNCGRVLTGPYCAHCGQKTPHTDLTLREFLHETTHELTHWEGKIPRTLRTLYREPGRLTVDFLAGRRARWLPPLRLYLICSLAYFVSGPLIESITHRSEREMAKLTITNADGTTTLTPETRQELAEGWPGRVFGVERLERALANGAQFNKEAQNAIPKEMFVLLPIFALLTNLAWRRALPRYPAHLYLALHLHAAWFGLLAAVKIVTGFIPNDIVGALVAIPAFAYAVVYPLLTVRRVFGESWPRTLAKAAVVAAGYMIALFVMSFVVLGYVLMRM